MKNKPIILFDGVCNLCNSSVQFILNHEKNETLKFALLQSHFSQQFLKENNFQYKYLETIFLIEENKIYTKSQAIVRITKYLNFPLNILSFFDFLPNLFFKYVGDFFYNLISINRYTFFGKKEQCFLPSKNLMHRFID